jgi:CRP-like cAMP-binding protein
MEEEIKTKKNSDSYNFLLLSLYFYLKKNNFNETSEKLFQECKLDSIFKFPQSIKNEDIESEEKIGRKDIKTKSTVKKTLPLNTSLTKEDVYRFLSKNPNSRTYQEINIYAKYLSNNFQYFTKLKNEDSQLKVEKLTKVCKLQKTMKGEPIINYGEIGDKFYIVLEGIVEIFKPIYVEAALSPTEFIKKINNIKKMDGTDLRYNRIKNKNKTFFDSLNDKNFDSSLVNYMKYKQVFIMEEEEKLGEFKEGFSFGDIALIKKSARNATIKAKENCVLLTIEKDDYNKALLEFQKKKLSKDIDSFLKTYTFFKYFNHDKIINLFNCLNTKEIFKGEYLYKQNIQDDSIYFINYGTFSIDCIISFSWINDYINYINYSGKNILKYIVRNKKRKINEILKIVDRCKSKIIHYSPINEEKYTL